MSVCLFVVSPKGDDHHDHQHDAKNKSPFDCPASCRPSLFAVNTHTRATAILFIFDNLNKLQSDYDWLSSLLLYITCMIIIIVVVVVVVVISLVFVLLLPPENLCQVRDVFLLLII